MLVVVPLAFLRADIAGGDAELEHLLDQGLVAAGPPRRNLERGVADVGAVEAGADALAHVRFLGRAGIGAGGADGGAEHRVPHGHGQRLVEVSGDVGMGGDHFGNGHRLSSQGSESERLFLVDSSVSSLE